MSKTRYTKQQSERDAEILIRYGLYEEFEATKNLVENLCSTILSARFAVDAWREKCVQEQGRSLWSLVGERVKRAWRKDQ